jgi:RNA polymerase sigma factor (sigma-70 family)
MRAVRPIDQWFIDEILPHEAAFLQAARRIERDAEAAHDIVRDVYARLYALESWGSIANPRHYTLTMIRNLALERLRRAKVAPIEMLPDADDMDIVDDSPCQHQVLAGRDLLARVFNAIDAMPERCRTALILRKFNDQPAGEAAETLGISTSTLEKRLARATLLLSQAVAPLLCDEGLGELSRRLAATSLGIG